MVTPNYVTASSSPRYPRRMREPDPRHHPTETLPQALGRLRVALQDAFLQASRTLGLTAQQAELLCAAMAPAAVVFFFQAEDGIRDHCVTGAQTCALPICCGRTLLSSSRPASGRTVIRRTAPRSA